MNDNTTPFGGVTTLDIESNKVLDAAKDKLEGSVVIGFDVDGELYFASSYADIATVLLLLERAKKELLKVETYIKG